MQGPFPASHNEQGGEEGMRKGKHFYDTQHM